MSVNGVLHGKVAIVTGARRGFGRAIATRLAADGAAVMLVDRAEDELDQVVGDIRRSGGTADYALGDVTCRSDVERIVGKARSLFGPVTTMVNNAGVGGPYGPIGDIDPDEWWQAVGIHVRGPLLFMTAVLPDMIAAGAGHIVNVCSIGGKHVYPNSSAYCTGKGAEIKLTEHVAAESGARGIRAFAIQPGSVVTGLARDTMADPGARKWVPGLVEVLERMERDDDASAGLARCAALVADLVSGRFDILSGEFIDAEEDREARLAMAKQVRADREAASA